MKRMNALRGSARMLLMLSAALPPGCGGSGAASIVPVPTTVGTASPSPAPSLGPVNLPASDWEEGVIDPLALPPRSTLKSLPGGGTGSPVVTSNNPEVFTGNGVLFGTMGRSPSRGGGRLTLAGPFGFYIHHLNRSSGPKTVSIVMRNETGAEAAFSFFGSGYTQTETGGLGLGSSPDYRVSSEWVQAQHSTRLDDRLRAQELRVVWSKRVNAGAEIDGRFGARTGAEVTTAVVVSDTDSLAEINQVLTLDAAGDIARSGTPPPPFGREAGVYEKDTWEGTIHAVAPRGPRRAGFWINTATGSGAPQIQAFPALVSYHDSARESVGMYGNIYDLTIAVDHDGSDRETLRVRILFGSLVTASLSRYWDGVGLVDGAPVVLRHTPENRVTVLSEFDLPAGATRVVRFKAMVPGLTSIPQALWLESR